MLYLYTENFFLPARVKSAIKNLLGKGLRGPQAVQQSLMAGLDELNSPYCVNSPVNSQISTAGVLANAKTLAWAISQKRAGKIKHIVAGPNIAISAKSDNGIWLSPEIDVIIVPSQWVYDNYASDAPEIKHKLRIWPAGVDVPPLRHTDKEYDFLIFNKIGGNQLFFSIEKFLGRRGYKTCVVNYGSFARQEYLHLLEKSKFEIYLSESESQGLAMAEAWARNVPTFVWERGFWDFQGHHWEGLTASAYLMPENGARFKNFEEFEAKISDFMDGSYNPRGFAERELSNKVCARKYLEIYNNL